ncbi:MAG: type I methionyl aminopeptidase [Patescibacteria group bacterium]|nr:type I methionyl aminopeptidase [Patescibacteria group bacterium]
MITFKTKDEIQKMVEGGKILSKVLTEVLKKVKVGVTELELDAFAEKLIVENGAEPAFKKVKGYKHTLCVSTNDTVVHGVPTNYKFKVGDVVGIDCGLVYKEFYTDTASTLRVENQKSPALPDKNQKENEKDSEIQKFLKTGEVALGEAIKQAKIGNRIGDISKIIQDVVEGSGYSVVRSLVGHGVGRELHEEPEVPGFLSGSISKTPELKMGMTIAIEVIYNMGKKDVVYSGDDDWTIKTKDGSLSSTFEHTIAITKNGPRVLT